MKMTEKEIEDKMRKKLKAHGGLCIKFTSPSMSGVPDRIVIMPHGRIIFVELKREGGVISERQKYVHKLLRKCHVEVRVVIGLREAMGFVEGVCYEHEHYTDV